MDVKKSQPRFRPIPEYPGYAVNRLGEVKSVKTGRILNYKLHKSGLLVVKLFNEGKRVKCYVHWLVAECFVRGRGEGRWVVRFIDENKLNVSAENLKWITHREATQTSGKRGDKRVCGEEVPGRKPTWDAVDRIRAGYEAGMTMKMLAAKYKVSGQAISNIVHGRSWKPEDHPGT